MIVDVERAAMALAEQRVPGSTRAGGHYHLSEAWRSMIQAQALQVHSLQARTLASVPAWPATDEAAAHRASLRAVAA